MSFRIQKEEKKKDFKEKLEGNQDVKHQSLATVRMHYNPRPKEEGENNNVTGASGELETWMRGYLTRAVMVVKQNCFQNYGNSTFWLGVG